MNAQKEKLYEDVESLIQIVKNLKGRKFRLHCGHHVTLCHWLGNDITIINGKEPKIICSLCGH